MTEIEVRDIEDGSWRVEVREGGDSTVHEVTANAEQIRRYGGGATAEDLIRASFRFLLEREPKEAILRAFALPVIERYFPEYPRTIKGLLA